MNEAPHQTAYDWRSLWLDIAVAAACLLIALPSQAYMAEQPVSTFRLLDRSWQYSMPALLAESQLSGRDFVYTYGPLYQWLHSAAYWPQTGDLATIARWHDTPEVVLSLLGCWLLLGLVGTPRGWRRGLLLAWTLLLVAPTEFHAGHLKPMGGLTLVGLCGAAFARWMNCRRFAAFATPALWAITPPLMMLYSFDFGVVGVVSLLAYAAAIVVASRLMGANERRCVILRVLPTGAAVLAGSVCFVGASRLVPGWVNYLSNLLTLTRAYGLEQAAPAAAGVYAAWCLAAAAIIATGIALLYDARTSRGSSAEHRSRWWVMLAAVCFAAVLLRYPLTRSDWSHLYRGVMPAAFVIGCMAPGYLAGRRRAHDLSEGDASEQTGTNSVPRRWPLASAALAAVVLAPFAFTEEYRGGWMQRLAHARRMSLRAAHTNVADPTLSAAAEALRELPDNSVFVWPYGTMLNLLADKRNPCFTLQCAEGALGSLEDETAAHLRDERVPVLVYREAVPLAGRPFVTHNSAIFRLLLENYELREPARPGFAILEPAAVPLTWSERDLGQKTRRQFQPGGSASEGWRGVQFDLREAHCRASDLFAMSFRVAPTMTFPLGKPGRGVMSYVLDDGTQFAHAFDVPPDGELRHVLLSARGLDDPWFERVFARQAQNSDPSEPRIVALQIGWQPLDALSFTPEWMHIERLAVLEPESP